MSAHSDKKIYAVLPEVILNLNKHCLWQKILAVCWAQMKKFNSNFLSREMPHARVIQKPIASQNPYQALGEARKLFLLNLNFGSEDINGQQKTT